MVTWDYSIGQGLLFFLYKPLYIDMDSGWKNKYRFGFPCSFAFGAYYTVCNSKESTMVSVQLDFQILQIFFPFERIHGFFLNPCTMDKLIISFRYLRLLETGRRIHSRPQCPRVYLYTSKK